MRHKFPAAVLSVATLLTATGCSSSFFKPWADPVGTWTLAPDGGSTLVLRDDHTFSAEGVFQVLACRRHTPATAPTNACTNGSLPVDFAGTWYLNRAHNNVLYFDDEGTVMTGYRDGQTLGFYLGSLEEPEPTYEYIHD